MNYNPDSFARLIGGSAKLTSRMVEDVSTFAQVGHVTLRNGQVFRYEVWEVTQQEAVAEAAAIGGRAEPK